MRKIILVFIVLSLPVLLRAQDNYTLIFLPQLQQSAWLNASNLPENKVSIGLPVVSGVSFYVYNSGFTFHQAFHNLGDTAQSVNMGNVFNHLKPLNYFGVGASATILSLNVARNLFSGGFSITDKVDINLTYPSSFFKFFWYGNGPTLGQNVQVGNFGVHATWYREFAFHLAYNYKKWTFGINPKILVGKTNIDTRSTSLILYTDPNMYALKATANIDVKMSGIEDSADKSQGGYFSSTSKAIDYLFNTQNIGHAIDLAAKYEFNDHFNVSAGINNLGSIHWNSFVHNYTVNNQTGSFDGLQLANFFQGDTTAITGQVLKDSIKNIVKFKEDSNPYVTKLPYDLFAMANYQFKHHWFGVELTARRFNSEFVYAGTLCYQLKFGKHFTGALTYTVKSFSGFNVGGGLIFQFANMQFYFVTDNWYAAIVPLDSRNANLNAGVNLVFGNRLRKDNYAKDHSSDSEYKPLP